jgi:hypothetical protein
VWVDRFTTGGTTSRSFNASLVTARLSPNRRFVMPKDQGQNLDHLAVGARRLASTACGRFTGVAAVSVQPLPSSSLGNRILRAETGGRIQAQSAGERPEFGSQTGRGSLTRGIARVFIAREAGSVCRDCVVGDAGIEPATPPV